MRNMMYLMVAIVCVGYGMADSLYDALTNIKFLQNESVVRNTSMFTYITQPACYLEPENQTSAVHSWAVSSFPYLYEDTGHPGSCSVEKPYSNNTDRPGGDIDANPISPPTGDACATRCCATNGCFAWVFAAKAPGPFMGCNTGDACCYLKGNVPEPKPDSPCCVSGVVNRTEPGKAVPPLGMRSAIPLGGIAAGTVELRGDGTLHAATIENKSPAGGAKLAEQTDSAFFVRVNGVVRALKTSTPGDWGVDGVDALGYTGLYPIARLRPVSPIDGVDVSLFAFHRFAVDDMNASAVPAIAWVFALKNSGSSSADIDVLATWAKGVEQDTARPTKDTPTSQNASNPAQCSKACRASSTCQSWEFKPPQSCTFQTSVPFNVHETGTSSGVKGTWTTTNPSSTCCMSFTQAVDGPSGGTAAICAGKSCDSTVGRGAGDTMSDILQSFSSSGTVSSVGQDGVIGAVSVSLGKVAPGDSTTVPMLWGWHFPNFTYVDQNIGNFYDNLVSSGDDAANTLANNLPQAVQEAVALHTPFIDSVAASSTPEWLADVLVNSYNHVRIAFWTRDATWYEWEAYDCVNVLSVHNSGERSMPYQVAMRDGVKSQIKSWASQQLPNGMIQEQLACGCTGGIDASLGKGCGRVMSDVSSMFIAYLDFLLQFGNETEFVSSFWPHVKDAALWQISVSPDGLPEHLVNTYDILGPQEPQYASYNAVFNLLAYKSAARIARLVGDTAFAASMDSNVTFTQKALDAQMWNESAGFYTAFSNAPGSLMADNFWGQTIAFTLGHGVLVANESRLKSHQAAVARIADTPYGLRIMTGRHALPGPWQDNAIWQMASPNWATVNLWLGMAPSTALEQPAKSLGLWRNTLNDLWNIAGLAGGVGEASEGQPWVTSHYGYFMSSWHLVFAMCGQNADLPNSSLSFTPADQSSSTVTLPFLLNGGVGTMSIDRVNHKAQVSLSAGINSITLQHLSIDGHAAPSPATLTPGGPPVEWTF